METVLTAGFAHFFPSVLIRHSYLPDSIRHPTYTHFKKKTTLCTTSFFVLPSQDIKERKVTKHDIFYTVSTFLREKVLKFRDCWEILAEVVGGCLFHPEVLFAVISQTGIQHYFSCPGR